MEKNPNTSLSMHIAADAATLREATIEHLGEIKKAFNKRRKEFKPHRIDARTIVICHPSAIADIRAQLDKYSII